MLGKPLILSLFLNSFNKFSKIYQHSCKILCIGIDNVSASKKDNKEEILSLEQFQELQDWCVDDVDVPKLPEPEMVCLTKGDNTEVIFLHTG